MTDRSRARLAIVQVVVFSLVATLLGRLAYLQLVEGPSYTATSHDTRTRTIDTEAVRGLILDDQGRPIVANRVSLVLTVDRSALRNSADRGAAALDRLGELLATPPSDLRAALTNCGEPAAADPPVCWNGSPYVPVPVAEDVSPEVALQVAERPESYPGVVVEPRAVRSYPAPEGANAAHLVGYLGAVTADDLAADPNGVLGSTDEVGRTGLEMVYDRDLRGRDGSETVTVDRAGAVTGTAATDPAVPGNHLVTSIDAGLQALTERSLSAAIARARASTDPDGVPYRADSGAAVVMDVTDGRVLAMASYPTYDPGLWVGGISTADYAHLTAPEAGAPLLFRAIAAQVAPASTFKVGSTSAAMEAGYNPAGPYDCTSSMSIGGRSFTNYESRAYGPISLARALEVSCDTVFYRIAYDMWLHDGGSNPAPRPTDAIFTMASGWGLGAPTAIDLPGEASGRIADRAWKLTNWQQTKDDSCRHAATGYPDVTDPARATYLTQIARENCTDGWRFRAGDAANLAIGQGETLVTPIQMAVAYAALANGGTLWQPTVGRAVISPDGTVVREIAPVAAGRLPVSAATLDYIRAALQETTRTGTGAAPFRGFPLGQVPVATKTGTGEVFGKQSTSWFLATTDRYVVAMTVSQGGTGSGTSGPSVRAILDGLYGVHDGVADPTASLLPGGVPPTSLPTGPIAP
jgi:penicillin-binding protein 2